MVCVRTASQIAIKMNNTTQMVRNDYEQQPLFEVPLDGPSFSVPILLLMAILSSGSVSAVCVCVREREGERERGGRGRGREREGEGRGEERHVCI